MKYTKNLYVPAGQVVRLENVWARKVIVDGRLIVANTIHTSLLRGKGTVSALVVRADKIRVADLTVYSKLIAQTLYAKRLYALNCFVSGCIAVTTYAECNFVKAGRLIVSLFDIGTIEAAEAICLNPKARGFFRTIFDAYRMVHHEHSKARPKAAPKMTDSMPDAEDNLVDALTKLLPLLRENGYRLEIDPSHQTVGVINSDAA